MARPKKKNRLPEKNETTGSSYSIGRNPGGAIRGLTQGATYGEGQQIKEQASAFGMPKTQGVSTQQVAPKPMPQMDVFAETQRPNEPVTSGLPFGPGASPVSQETGIEDVKKFIYDSWLATGDDSLLEYL